MLKCNKCKTKDAVIKISKNIYHCADCELEKIHGFNTTKRWSIHPSRSDKGNDKGYRTIK